MGQKRRYKQYSKKYKEEAVALVREQGNSVPEATKSLGIASITHKIISYEKAGYLQIFSYILSNDTKQSITRFI